MLRFKCMLLNVISRTKLFTISHSAISVKKFKMTANASQLFWPQSCGCYVTNYFGWISKDINMKKETVANSCVDLNSETMADITRQEWRSTVCNY